MNTTAPAIEHANPHCAPQWPHGEDRAPLVANLQEAITAAGTLAQLIHADLNLAEARALDGSGPEPFRPDVAFGLRMALQVCLSRIETIAELMDDMSMARRASPAKEGKA